MNRELRWVTLAVIAGACGGSGPEAKSVPPAYSAESLPAEPLVALQTNTAYSGIAEIVERERKRETTAHWLDGRTDAISDALTLLRMLRGAPKDVYAISLGRIAWLHADTAAKIGDVDPELTAKLMEKTALYFARCERFARGSPPHVDAWLAFCAARVPARQPK